MVRKQADNECVANVKRERARDHQIENSILDFVH